MIYATAGTDTYGRVKSVNGTPIVTKFAMLQVLPIYPLESFYFAGHGDSEWKGIPFIAGTTTQAIHSMPLANVDRTSVLMAYLRGVFGALTLFGSLSLIFGLMYLMGQRMDSFAMGMLAVLLSFLFVGVLGGLVTYCLPLCSPREFQIRSCCGELLGLCADPARTPTNVAAHITSYINRVEEALVDEGLNSERNKCIIELIRLRASLPSGIDNHEKEAATDHLLQQLAEEHATPDPVA